MTEIDLTLATAPQLAVLLDLSADEAERVARAGPFADLQALRAVLPARWRDVALPERAEKPDLNAATREMLVDGLGFSLVPWRPVIEKLLGQQLAATVTSDGVSWEVGRARGPSVG